MDTLNTEETATTDEPGLSPAAEVAVAPAPAETTKPAAPSKRTRASRKTRRDPLDHDRNGRKGGVASGPAVQHLVVVKDSVARGLTHGEVIAVAKGDVKALLSASVARNATDTEVELAQPRVRAWAPQA